MRETCLTSRMTRLKRCMTYEDDEMTRRTRLDESAWMRCDDEDEDICFSE